MPRSPVTEAARLAALVTAFVTLVVATAFGASPASGDAALGERIYRFGGLPSGPPIAATVAGDVAVDGSQFPCQSCHLRSGLGAVEGDLITPPITWLELAVPRDDTVHWVDRDESALDDDELDKLPPWSRQGTGIAPAWLDAAHVRPAYTEAGVLRAIREGIDPTGRALNPVMPRYAIGDEAAAHLLAYLRDLSAEYSPGVDSTTIRFATVVGPDVPDDETRAMLEVLETFVRPRNGSDEEDYRPTATGGAYRMAEYDLAYRKLSLVTWKLQGSPDTWPVQLDAFYDHEPVFALIGGIGDGDWAPIHAFCERRHLPQIFPVTDEPVIDGEARYTLYLSRGAYGEGTAAARYVRDARAQDARIRVLQIHRSGAGARAARGFVQAAATLGTLEVVEWSIDGDAPLDRAALGAMLSQQQPDVVALWSDGRDLGALAAIADSAHPLQMVLLSDSLLEGRLSAVPRPVRRLVRLTHPYGFDDDCQAAFDLRRWLAIRGLPATHMRVRSQMYLAGWMLAEAVDAMGGDYYRERLLDAFDMIADQDFTAAAYPRLSFGPGQRFALKGCYVAGLSDDDDPHPVPLTGWITY